MTVISGANTLQDMPKVIPCMQIAEMDDTGAAAKGLYGMSKLMDSADQRGTFYGSGGLERMQGLLANASISDRIHRKISSLFGDLAMRGEVRRHRHRENARYPSQSPARSPACWWLLPCAGRCADRNSPEKYHSISSAVA